MASRRQNPWKRLATRVVYENPWITVREDDVLRPDGRPGIYGVVQARVATGAVPIDDQGRIVLVGQYRYPTDVYSWEIPEGGTERGEDPFTCIQRELREEAGVTAARWTPLGPEIHLSNCHSSEVGHLWLAEGLTDGEQALDETEVIELRRVSWDEAWVMVSAGEIVDALTVIGLHRAWEVVRRR